mgnify:CR=1 FL=1
MVKNKNLEFTKKLFLGFKLKDILKINNNTILILLSLFVLMGALANSYNYDTVFFEDAIFAILGYLSVPIVYVFLSNMFNLKSKFRDYLIIMIFSGIPNFIYATALTSSYILSTNYSLFDYFYAINIYLSKSLAIPVIVIIWSVFLTIKYLSEYQKKLNLYQIIGLFIMLGAILTLIIGVLIGILLVLINPEFYI